MTSNKEHSRKHWNRATLGDYIRAERHLIDEHTAKSIELIANETAIPVSTLKHWLIRDHRGVCCRWWPMSARMLGELRWSVMPVSEAFAQEIIATEKDRR